MKTLLSVIGIFGAAIYGSAADAPKGDSAWSQGRVSEVMERSKTDPDALWELKEAPLELIERPLGDIWMIGASRMEDRLSMKKDGREAVWLATQAQVGLDPEYSARIFPIAREVILSHPEFEPNLAAKLQHMTAVLNRAASDEYYRYHSPDVPGTASDYSQLLSYAGRTPKDMAFRLVGPCIYSPYFPDRDHGDVMEASPATWARETLAIIAREHLGEEIPKDIEEARRWWEANEQRFAIQPPVLKPPLGAAKSSPSSRQKLPEPTAHHLQTAPAAGARTAWWLVAVVALGLLAFLLFRRRD